MGDGDGIFGVIGEELKKFGKSATAQVTGSDDATDSKQVNPLSALTQIGNSAASQISGGEVGTVESGSGSSKSTQDLGDHSVLGELKKMGLGAVSQVFGADLTSMQAQDEKFSQQSQEEVRAKIAAIYQEHAQSQKRKLMVEEQQKEQVEQQKAEIKHEQKKQQMDVQVAQTKASAENKNMGAE